MYHLNSYMTLEKYIFPRKKSILFGSIMMVIKYIREFLFFIEL